MTPFFDSDPIAESRTARCRSCGAEVVWVMTSTGKRMPIDAKPADGGNVAARGDHDSGLPVVIVARRGDRPNGPSYTSHFVTCAQADEWRRS